ncbi:MULTISPECIES: hypothetical protein, partial [unclassified Bradyrhizobium]
GLIPALAGFECAIRHQPNRTSTPGKAEFLPSLVGQISDLTLRVSPKRGAARDRHERCGEMRWT